MGFLLVGHVNSLFNGLVVVGGVDHETSQATVGVDTTWEGKRFNNSDLLLLLVGVTNSCIVALPWNRALIAFVGYVE